MRRKKLWSKAMALACAATMLASSVTAFAETSSTGSSSIEYKDTELGAVINCVLPTINAGTYDFTVDIKGGVLNDFDSKYAASDNVYFLSEKTPAKIETADASGKKFYLLTQVEDTSITKLKAVLDGKDPANLTIPESTYYVWQPDASKKDVGAGKWTEITADNITDFVDFGTLDTGKIKGANVTAKTLKAGAIITDGKIYVMDYKPVSDLATLQEYVTIGDVDGVLGATAIKDGLLYGADTSPSSSNVNDATTDNIKYTAPEMQYTKKSAPAKITNKSSVPVAVSVNVSVDNSDGLTFEASTAVAANTTKNTMYIGIADDETTANTVAVAKDTKTSTVKAAMYGIIPAAGNSGMTEYQSTEKNPLTGSHMYYSYSGPNPTYSSMSFNIESAISKDSTGTTIYDLWKKYVDQLEDGTYVKPSINVVYDFETVTQDATTKSKYTGKSGAVYVTKDTTNFKGYVATYTAPKDAAPKGFTVTNTTFNTSAPQDVSYTLDLGSGTKAVTVSELAAILNVGEGINEVTNNTMWLTEGTNYTYDAATKKLTINKESMAGAGTGTYTFGIMLNNDTNYVYWTTIVIQ